MRVTDSQRSRRGPSFAQTRTAVQQSTLATNIDTKLRLPRAYKYRTMTDISSTADGVIAPPLYLPPKAIDDLCWSRARLPASRELSSRLAGLLRLHFRPDC